MQAVIFCIVYRFDEVILSGIQKCRQKSGMPQIRLPDTGVRQGWHGMKKADVTGRPFRHGYRLALRMWWCPVVVVRDPAWFPSGANHP